MKRILKENLTNTEILNNGDEGLWISPWGEMFSSDSRHVRTIIQNPEQFGTTEEHIDYLHKKYGEKRGWDGKAREELIRDAMKKGWIRIRGYSGKYSYISIQTDKLTKKHKDFLYYFANEILKDEYSSKFRWNFADVRIGIANEDRIIKTTMRGIADDTLLDESFNVVDFYSKII
jgi:hypothetical protein